MPLNTDAEYLRLSGLRDEIDQSIHEASADGQSGSAEGRGVQFYSRKDLQMQRDNLTTQMNRRALELEEDATNKDFDFAQSVNIQLPRY